MSRKKRKSVVAAQSTGVSEAIHSPNYCDETARIALEKAKLELEQAKEQGTWLGWLRQCKLTDYISTFAVVFGVLLAYSSGLFDLKTERLDLDELRLSALQAKLDSKQEELATLVAEESALQNLATLKGAGISAQLLRGPTNVRTLKLSDPLSAMGIWLPNPPDDRKLDEVLNVAIGIQRLARLEISKKL